MINQDYLEKVQSALTEHFWSKLDKSDVHDVSIYPNDNANDAMIIYHPNWLDNPQDNDGEYKPKRYVEVHALTSLRAKQTGDKWRYLVNQQFIHANRFLSKNYMLNFNFRRDNDISTSGAKALSHDLKSKFDVTLTSEGLLLIAVKDSNIIIAFQHMIEAVQFINHNGINYISKRHMSWKELDEKVDNATNNLEAMSKKVHRDRSTRTRHKHTNKGPKAPGRKTKGFSSITGTIAAKNYEKEHRHAKRAKSIKKPTKKVISLKGAGVITSGRLKHTDAQLKELLKSCGAHMQQTLNGATEAMICNKPNKSKKYQNALKKHVHVLSEEQLVHLASKK